MNKKRIGIFIALLAMVCMGLRAQSATSLRINEVLVVNDQNYQDDYGLHNAWIEIFNTSFASVNLEGCFLTNDKNNPTKYPIPKGDVLTLIKPRQHALFWADGMPNRGTFHVNFTLDPNKENYIALYDSNGKTLIDDVFHARFAGFFAYVDGEFIVHSPLRDQIQFIARLVGKAIRRKIPGLVRKLKRAVFVFQGCAVLVEKGRKPRDDML